MKLTSHAAAFVQNCQHLITMRKIKITQVTDDNKKLIKVDTMKLNAINKRLVFQLRSRDFLSKFQIAATCIIL